VTGPPDSGPPDQLPGSPHRMGLTSGHRLDPSVGAPDFGTCRAPGNKLSIQSPALLDTSTLASQRSSSARRSKVLDRSLPSGPR
jgi:hypothetical protein